MKKLLIVLLLFAGLMFAKVDINKANISQLSTLNGIGQKIAERIVKYRDDNKTFKKIEDITKIKGIGTKKFEKIKADICVKCKKK